MEDQDEPAPTATNYTKHAAHEAIEELIEERDLARAERQAMLNDLMNIARYLGVEPSMVNVATRLSELLQAEDELIALRDKIRELSAT